MSSEDLYAYRATSVASHTTNSPPPAEHTLHHTPAHYSRTALPLPDTVHGTYCLFWKTILTCVGGEQQSQALSSSWSVLHHQQAVVRVSLSEQALMHASSRVVFPSALQQSQADPILHHLYSSSPQSQLEIHLLPPLSKKQQLPCIRTGYIPGQLSTTK